MKLFLLIIIFIFSTQNLIKADDIRDFQIERMSIGDSLLDYFSIAEINKAVDESSEDRIYIVKSFAKKKFKTYEAVQVAYKENNNKMILTSIAGVISFSNKIEKCKKKMYQIDKNLTDLFPSADRKDWGKYDNPDSSGHYFPITFTFDDASMAMVSCHDWIESTRIDDNLKVSLFEAKYSLYVKNQN
tara:strand:- start:16239 stop:16799 length:561 start_codon:yes stop_codon:yes gene_type:complete